MSNGTFLYDNADEAFLNGAIDWVGDEIRVALIHLGAISTGAYTPASTDLVIGDIPLAARIAISEPLAHKDATGRVLVADDALFLRVDGETVEGDIGNSGDALVIYQHTGRDSTGRLIAFIDNAAGLPIATDGGDITVTWAEAPLSIVDLNAIEFGATRVRATILGVGTQHLGLEVIDAEVGATTIAQAINVETVTQHAGVLAIVQAIGFETVEQDGDITEGLRTAGSAP